MGLAGRSVSQPGTPAWADTTCLRVLAFSLQHPEGLGPEELTTHLALPSLWLMLITLQGWVEGSEAPGRGHVLSPDSTVSRTLPPFPLDPPAQGPQETFKQGEVTRGLRAGGLTRVESEGKKQSRNSARE